jgi:hypothetical protein
VTQRRWLVSIAFATLATTSLATVASAHPNVDPSPAIAPDASRSTSGDYATDVFGDPWDFSNDEDVPPLALIGSENSYGISRNSSNGTLTVASVNNSTIKLVRTWGVELPWGRDGLVAPVNADRYTHLSFSMCLDQALHMAVHYWNADGGVGLFPFFPKAGCATYDFDLRDISANPPGYQLPWAGSMTRVELLRGGTPTGQNPLVNITLDWVRLRRADAPVSPPSGVPIPKVLTPNVEGGADYATSNGNAWDFNGADDVVSTGDIANIAFANGEMSGATVANDSFVELPLRSETNPDRYHRATVDMCLSGQMSFANAPGGGMNARFAWLPKGYPAWSETQDIVVYPGCHRMTVDLSTTPALAVNDEGTVHQLGWRGQRFERFRFDINEDPGVRNFTLREIKFADDAAFSTNYDITYTDAANQGGTADIWVTTNRGQFDGTLIAQSRPVTSGVNTFRWNGTTATGAQMPNGTYWVYITMRKGSNVGTAYSTGPVRIERPVPATPSFFVPITPSRLLDTRTGVGGNIAPLGEQVFTEVDVTGVGGVPETGVTAVVLNVTVDQPTAAGFLTAWPSGEPRPGASNLNFVPGQTVPNLVTVKIGANGKVNLFNSTGWTHVIADVVGYYTTTAPPGGGRFTPLTPTRLLDTRSGIGRAGSTAPVAAGQSIDLTVVGVGGVPSTGVSGVALNVTVDQPTGTGFVTTWPAGQGRPNASTHNFVPGLTAANLVLAKVGAGGKVSIFNSAGSTHLVADVIGYFSSSGGAFVPVSPRRLVDTRDGTGIVAGQLGPESKVTPSLATGSPVPSSATAVVVNVTSVNSSHPSYVTAYPAGVSRPNASTMNPRPGVPVPNQAYLKLGSTGRLDVFNFSGSTDVVIDVFGYIV